MPTRPLRFVLLVTFGIASLPAVANAQGQGFGYAFIGPMAVHDIGDRTVAWNGGGGGEAWVTTNVSVGGELGLLGFPAVEERCGSGYCSSMPSAGSLLLSFNGSRHFAAPASGWRPFVTGGISFLVDRESFGFFNAGAGVERWMTPHLGVRLEVRDQFVLTPGYADSVLLGFRGGIVLR
jgi:hypothetical protein